MMGDQYELYSVIRLDNLHDAGSLTGMIGASMVDINHPDCGPAPGGNQTYLYPGDASMSAVIAEPDTDGVPARIATDQVEMRSGTGDYFTHFGYLPAGSYRIAFTCSGEWDNDGDDDYPSGPDGRLDFQKIFRSGSCDRRADSPARSRSVDYRYSCGFRRNLDHIPGNQLRKRRQTIPQ